MEKLNINKLIPRNFCPICGGNYIVRDNVKTINPNAFEILNLKECVKCKHWWIDPLPTQSYLMNLQSKNSEYIGNISYGEDIIDFRVIKNISKLIMKQNIDNGVIKILNYGFKEGDLYNFFDAKCFKNNKIEIFSIGIEEIFDIFSFQNCEKFKNVNSPHLIVLKDFIERFEDPIMILNVIREFTNRSNTLILCVLPNCSSMMSKLLLGNWQLIKPLFNLHYFSSKSAEILFKKSKINLIKKYNYGINLTYGHANSLDVIENSYKSKVVRIIRMIKSKIKIFIKNILIKKERWILFGKYD